MSTPLVEQQNPLEELVVPPLPRWLAPVALSLTAALGLAIWLLWSAADPAAALADPSMIFLCH